MRPTIICAWCRKLMEQGDPGPVSHGICDECTRKVLDENEGEKK